MPKVSGDSLCMDNAASLEREQDEFDAEVTATRRMLQAEFDGINVNAPGESWINTWLRARLKQLGKEDLYMHILIRTKPLPDTVES